MPTKVEPFKSFQRSKYVHDYFHNQLSDDTSNTYEAAKRHLKLSRDHKKIGTKEDESYGNSHYRDAHASAGTAHALAGHTLYHAHTLEQSGKDASDLKDKAKIMVASANEKTKHSLGLASDKYNLGEIYNKK